MDVTPPLAAGQSSRRPEPLSAPAQPSGATLVLRRLGTAVAGLAVAALAGAACVLSFDALRILAVTGGARADLAYLYPAGFDALLAIALISVLLLRPARLLVRLQAGLILALLVVAAAAANVVVATDTAVDVRQAAVAVAVVPWVMLVIGLWLFMLPARRLAPYASAADAPDRRSRVEHDIVPFGGEERDPELAPPLESVNVSHGRDHAPHLEPVHAPEPEISPVVPPTAAPETPPVDELPPLRGGVRHGGGEPGEIGDSGEYAPAPAVPAPRASSRRPAAPPPRGVTPEPDDAATVPRYTARASGKDVTTPHDDHVATYGDDVSEHGAMVPGMEDASRERSEPGAVPEHEELIHDREPPEDQGSIAEHGPFTVENPGALSQHGQVLPEDRGAVSEPEPVLPEAYGAISEYDPPLPEDGGVVSQHGWAGPEDEGEVPEQEHVVPEPEPEQRLVPQPRAQATQQPRPQRDPDLPLRWGDLVRPTTGDVLVHPLPKATRNPAPGDTQPYPQITDRTPERTAAETADADPEDAGPGDADPKEAGPGDADPEDAGSGDAGAPDESEGPDTKPYPHLREDAPPLPSGTPQDEVPDPAHDTGSADEHEAPRARRQPYTGETTAPPSGRMRSTPLPPEE
jgi:hypothetical protein